MAAVTFLVCFGIVIVGFIVTPLLTIYKQKDETIIPKVENINPFKVTYETFGFWNPNKIMVLEGGTIWSSGSKYFTETHIMNISYPRKSCYTEEKQGKSVRICENETLREYWWPEAIKLDIQDCLLNTDCKFLLPVVENKLPMLHFSDINMFPLDPYYKWILATEKPYPPSQNLSGLDLKGPCREILYWKPLYLRVQGFLELNYNEGDSERIVIDEYDHFMALLLNSGQLDGFYTCLNVSM